MTALINYNLSLSCMLFVLYFDLGHTRFCVIFLPCFIFVLDRGQTRFLFSYIHIFFMFHFVNGMISLCGLYIVSSKSWSRIFISDSSDSMYDNPKL